MRIRVTDVFDLFTAGLSVGQIIGESPDLEREDIVAAITYAAEWIDRRGIAA